MIHMKNQALFSSKKLKCRLLQFLFGALRVNLDICIIDIFDWQINYNLSSKIAPLHHPPSPPPFVKMQCPWGV